ncbi:MAG: DUF692 family protein [Anaerolineae bacterium]
MEFTINWSPEARDLLHAGKIRIDRFKCADWDSMIADARVDAPIYVHFPLVIGNGTLAKTDWARVEAMMRDTNTPHVNLHLEPRHSALKGLDDDAAMEVCIREVQSVVDRFGGDDVVLENVPYRNEHADKLKAAVTAEGVAAVIRATGCGLLLDTGHAQITAHSLGVDVYDFMRALPLDRLMEVHQAGVCAFSPAILERARQFEGFMAYFQKYEGQNPIGMWMDHFGMESERDWEVFAWTLERIQTGEAREPRFVSFEYGGIGAPFGWRSESDVIARDVPRFYSMVHAAQPAP